MRASPRTGARFSAEFVSTLSVPEYGPYRFDVRGSPDAQVHIDGQPVGREPVVLAIGSHALRVAVRGARTKIELWWTTPGSSSAEPVPPALLYRPPVTNSGLLGTYFRTLDCSGPPAFARIDPEIAMQFGELPLPRPYSVEWTGKIFVPAGGKYAFGTDSIDESALRIDGALLIENDARHTLEREITLRKGWHDIALRFADHTAHSRVFLYWTRPDGSREIIPSMYLSPPLGGGYPDPSGAGSVAPILPAGATEQSSASSPRGDGRHGPLPLNIAPVQMIGDPGSRPGHFREPRAVAVGAGGKAFVCDTGNQRVQILDRSGTCLAVIEGGSERFGEPFDLAIADNGELIVLDSRMGWIYRFDQQGKALGRIGGPEAHFYHPRGLVAGRNGDLYVADTGGGRLVRMVLSGDVLDVLGTSGEQRLSQPSAIALAADGGLFVAGMHAAHVIGLNGGGHFGPEFPIPATTSFNAPRLTFAADGSLMMTAPALHRIQQYAADGRLVAEWGALGDGPGEFRLPTGITRQGNDLWIADTGNDRIQRWQIR